MRLVGTVAGLLLGAFALRFLAKRAARFVGKLLASPRSGRAEEGGEKPDQHAKKSRLRMKVKILVGEAATLLLVLALMLSLPLNLLPPRFAFWGTGTMQILSQVVGQLGTTIEWLVALRAKSLLLWKCRV